MCWNLWWIIHKRISLSCTNLCELLLRLFGNCYVNRYYIVDLAIHCVFLEEWSTGLRKNSPFVKQHNRSGGDCRNEWQEFLFFNHQFDLDSAIFLRNFTFSYYFPNINISILRFYKKLTCVLNWAAVYTSASRYIFEFLHSQFP